MSEAAYRAVQIASEGQKQADVAAAFATQTGAALQAAVRSAERRHLARLWQAARPNGMSAAQMFVELRADPQPAENFTLTDDTQTIDLVGWRYTVSVTVDSWGSGDHVRFLDAGGSLRADFTDGGINPQIVELPFGNYVLLYPTSTTTGVTLTIQTTS